jgi:hypothetical protein
MDSTPNGTELRMGLLSEWTQPRMGLNPEWTQHRMGLNLEWTQPWMDSTPNGLNLEWDLTPNGTQPRMDSTPNGTQPRMDSTPNGTQPRMDSAPNGTKPRMDFLTPEWWDGTQHRMDLKIIMLSGTQAFSLIFSTKVSRLSPNIPLFSSQPQALLLCTPPPDTLCTPYSRGWEESVKVEID